MNNMDTMREVNPFFFISKGRKRELITAAALYIAGAIITGFAPDLAILVTGRALYGIGIGMVSLCSQPFWKLETT